MPHRWTDEERNTLRRRWLAGDTSRAIAAAIPGVTRHAVMGMVNRMGLMGLQGADRPTSKPPAPAAVDPDAALDAWCDAWTEVRAAVAHMGCDQRAHEGEVIEHLLDLDQPMTFLVVAARSGRHVPTLQVICGPQGGGNDDVDDLIVRLGASGVWPEGAPVPERWRSRDTAGQALILDAMVLAGWLDLDSQNGEPRYRIRPRSPEDIKPFRITH